MSVHHESKTINIEQNGDEYQIVFDCKYDTYLYGADADGNRGERRTELINAEVLDAYKNGHLLMASDIPVDIMTQAESEVES